jgi:ABC-type transport system substrate-binding protein
MKRGLIIGALVLLGAAGAAGYWWDRNHLVPVPLVSDETLFTRANPDPGQDQASVEMLLPPGPGRQTFVLAQVGEPLIQRKGEDGWTGLLADAVWTSANRRHWRVRLRQAVRLHDGHLLEARWALAALHRMKGGPFEAGAKVSVVDDRTLGLDFAEPWDLLAHLSDPGAVMVVGEGARTVGSGPFMFATAESHETYLARFDGYRHGPAGLAAVRLPEDPSLMDGHQWARDLVARRYALAIYPGNVPPEDMSDARNAPYDQVRLKDGTVWFVSRRMRRLHPFDADWTRTALFGAWQADMDLPYDPR